MTNTSGNSDDKPERLIRAAQYVAGAPCLEEIEGFASAHLADWNAVGAQAQRRANQFGERCDAILGSHGNEVGRGALQLARVLDDDDAIFGFRDFGQKCVRERRLAG